MGLRLLLGPSRLFGRLVGLRLCRLMGLRLLLGLRLRLLLGLSRLFGRLLARAFESLLSKMRWSSRTDSASSGLASLRLSHWSLAKASWHTDLSRRLRRRRRPSQKLMTSAAVSTGFRISHSARCRSPSSSVMGRWRVASGSLTTAKLLMLCISPKASPARGSVHLSGCTKCIIILKQDDAGPGKILKPHLSPT